MDSEKKKNGPDTTYPVHEILESSDEEDGLPNTKEGIDKLLKKWLSLETPDVNDKMIDFLLQEGVCESLLTNITLIDPKIKMPSGYRKGEELPHRDRDYSDMMTLRRSYNCMEILSSNSKFNSRLLQSKFRPIVIQLFDVFKFNSNGNFHHFRKLFENLLRFKPIEVFDIILTAQSEKKPPLILNMLDFLDESPVAASLGTILFFPLRLTVAETERKKRLHHFLEAHQFMKKILLRVGYSDLHSWAASDFLFRIIDECTRVESSDVITRSMENPNDCLVDWILEILFSKSPKNGNIQKASCFKVLLALLSKSAPKEFEVPITTGNFYTTVTQKTPNGLADIYEIVREKVIKCFPQICELLHEDAYSPKTSQGFKLPGHEVKLSFPSMRLGAFEVMYEAIKELDEIEEALEKIPAYLWKLMTAWFFEYRFNNVYHAVFYKIIIAVIRSNHVPTLKNLFSQTKFLTRMIEHYDDKEYGGCRGYIMLICNFLRLTGDSQKPSEYIHMMLVSHHSWKNFLPKLRDDTLHQVELQVQDDPSFQRPLPHTGPLSISQENDDMISFLSRLLKAGDIDLGSQFAYSLGFLGNQADEDDSFDLDEEEAKKRKKNRKKREKKKRSQLLKSSVPNSPVTTSKSNSLGNESPKLPKYQPPPTYSSNTVN